MMKFIRRSMAAGLTLALTAPAAWADSTAATPAAAGAATFPGSVYGPGPWMMGSWGGGPMMGYGSGGGGVLMGLMMMLGVVILAALVIFVFRFPSRHEHHYLPHPGHGSAGLHALDERYARGDINREEYQQKKRDILGL